MKKLIKIFIIFPLFISILSLSFCYYYYKTIETKVTSAFGQKKWETPSKVYSSPYIIGLNSKTKLNLITSSLKKLDYLSVQEIPISPGQFSIEESESNIIINIFKRKLDYFDITEKENLYNIELSKDDEIVNISDTNNKKYERLLFNPQKVTEFFGPNKQERKLLKLKDFPPHVLYAVICSEDKRFLNHKGVDPKGILRAVIKDLAHGKIKEGGSTITQQLVKNLFLSHRKSIIRKFNEAVMAIILENNFPKDQILEAYLNEIYLGQKGSIEIRGMGQAAQFYFDKEIKDITISEAALLTAIIPSPGGFSPFKKETRAFELQKNVLRKMLNEKTITLNEFDLALNEKILLSTKKYSKLLNFAPFFVDHLKSEIDQKTDIDDFKSRDLRIYSTIKPDLQRAAKLAISKHLARLSSDYSWIAKQPADPSDKADGALDMHGDIEGALVALDPKSGHIFASVGGRNYSKSNYNRVIFGLRQPGSIFKPFVFLTAFNDRKGIQTITPRTLVINAPLTINFETQTWSPKNYEEEFSEPVNIFEIIYKSINIPTVRIANSVGFEKVSKTLSNLGFKVPTHLVPSISLGSVEATLLEVARAYSVFANNGILVTPTTLIGITDNENNVLFKPSKKETPVFTPESCFMVSELLKYVIQLGTGKLAFNQGLKNGFYGKTGTTSNYHDAWFAGFTKDVVVVVWVGFDYKKNIKLPGSIAALPIWIEFMKHFYKDSSPTELLAPEGIEFDLVKINGTDIDVPFIKGTKNLKPPLVF